VGYNAVTMEGNFLQGRTAVVTGGSRGLGKAIAIALGSAGVRLALVSRDAEALEAAAVEIRGGGTEVEIFPTDVTDERQVRQLERDVLARFERVDILVNNAGTNVRCPVEEFTLEDWNRVISTNLTSAFLLCRSFVPQMKGRGYGRILNLASTMSHVSLPGRAAYSASKAGLLGFTRALALELATEGITVVAISPGPFVTEMNTPLLEDAALNAQFVARIPVGRWGEVREVGRLALYLCSPDAGFITGTDILIDGGWTAQ
jgi:NAD(P)-dependent dehydrogenase (short-subunit alcohol dehydrogenase family)